MYVQLLGTSETCRHQDPLACALVLCVQLNSWEVSSGLCRYILGEIFLYINTTKLQWAKNGRNQNLPNLTKF